MFSPKQFAMNHLGTDELPDTLAMEQVLDLLLAAHTAAGDQRSDLDETRIRICARHWLTSKALPRTRSLL